MSIRYLFVIFQGKCMSIFPQGEKNLSTKAKKYTENPVNFTKILIVKIKNTAQTNKFNCYFINIISNT